MYYKNWPKLINKGLILSIFALFSVILAGCFKGATRVGVLYFNDFEDFNLKNIEIFGWSNGNFGKKSADGVINYAGNKVLGRFNNTRIDVVIDKLPKHQTICIQFDLYLHDIWRNDVWRMGMDGSDKLVSGFSTDPAKWQSYPNWIGNGSPLNPPGANAFSTNMPGACNLINNPKGTFHYKMEFTEYHSDEKLKIDMSDAGEFFNLNCDRSWSIDNLKIYSIN